MMSVQSERALVIQNRAPKILCPEICVAEVVEQIWVPLACANQRLVSGYSFLKMSLGKCLVRLCKIRIRLGQPRGSHNQANHRAGNVARASSLASQDDFASGDACATMFAHIHPKFSISSSTSRRFSGEILPGPLCVPLYCHSSFCWNKRRSLSRESLSSLKVSAAVSASIAFGSTARLREASAAFNRTTRDASA